MSKAKHLLATCARFTPVHILLLTVLVAVPLLAVRKLLIKPLLEASPMDPAVAMGVGGFLSLVFLLIVFAWILKRFDSVHPSPLKLTKLVPETLFGAGVGFGAIASVFGLLTLTGNFKILGVGDPKVLVVAVGMVPLLSTAEEVVFRGILFRQLARRWNVKVALAVSGVLFGALHFVSGSFHLAGFTSAMLGGLILCTLYLMSENRLWMPIGFHASWNLGQVFFGASVSGTDDLGLYLRSTLNGPDWLTGGPFGPEASVFALIILVVLLGWSGMKART